MLWLLIIVKLIDQAQAGLSIVSPGAFFEQQEAILYDKVGAIIFKFDKPQWYDEFKFFMGHPCHSDKYSEDPLCPVFYYIHQALLEDLDDGLKISSFDFPEDIINLDFHCDIIYQHFQAVKVDESNMEDYLEILKKCTHGRYIETERISNYSRKFRSVYEKMEKKYAYEYLNILPNEKRQSVAAEINNRIGLSSLIFTHFAAIGERWTQAFSDCKSGFIPETLIRPDSLEYYLTKFANNLKSFFRMTIRHNGAMISKYYKSRLADCVLTFNTFYVRILVPVSYKKKTPITLVNIRAIPFLSSIGETRKQICFLQDFERGRQYNMAAEKVGLLVTSMAMEMKCDTVDFKFCKIPDPLEQPPDRTTLCARAMILFDLENTEDNDFAIQQACKITCNDIEDDKLPIIIRARDQGQTIYIAGSTSNEFLLECKNEDSKKIVPPTIGALGIIVPCHCVLNYKLSQLHPNFGNCPDEAIFSQILPTHWTGESIIE